MDAKQSIELGLQIAGAAMNVYEDRDHPSDDALGAIVEDSLAQCGRDADPQGAVMNLVYGLTVVAQTASVEFPAALERLAQVIEDALDRGDEDAICSTVVEMRAVSDRKLLEMVAMHLNSALAN
jgi:hypothetical protein